jgi:hypothetical protein
MNLAIRLRSYTPMAFFNTRYGYSQSVNNPDDEWITRKLIAELRTEKFDVPDDEHTQVSVANAHWSVTAQVSGLITFDNMDILEGEASDLPATMYLRDIPDEQLIRIWQAVVREDRESLLGNPWQTLEEIPPFVADYYRRA